MQNVYLIGDIHFSASQPWRLTVGDCFLQWFEQLQVEPNSILVALGDYTDEATNPGEVIRQLERFSTIASSKFTHTYYLVGNHDYKLYRGKPQLSFSFLKEKPDCTILDTPAEILEIGGLKTLSLPHYNYRNDLPEMFEYYSNLPKEITDQQYDLVIGHFADTSAPMFGHQADLTALKTKYFCLGDIHTRLSDNYIGSVYPTRVSETPLAEKVFERPRGLWKMSINSAGTVKKEHIPLPEFCRFDLIAYPDPLPEPPAQGVAVYTITGAASESVARAEYGDVFIRSIQRGAKKGTSKAVQNDGGDFFVSKPLDVFSQWMKEVDTPVSRPVAALVKKLLAE